MDEINELINNIQKIYYEKDIYPFPYDEARNFQRNFKDEFERYASNELLTADLNAYWMFIAGLASGGIEKRLEDAWQHYQTKDKLEKSFFECFPKYIFFEEYDISHYGNLEYCFRLYDNLRKMLLELIRLYEQSER